MVDGVNNSARDSYESFNEPVDAAKTDETSSAKEDVAETSADQRFDVKRSKPPKLGADGVKTAGIATMAVGFACAAGAAYLMGNEGGVAENLAKAVIVLKEAVTDIGSLIRGSKQIIDRVSWMISGGQDQDSAKSKDIQQENGKQPVVAFG